MCYIMNKTLKNTILNWNTPCSDIDIKSDDCKRAMVFNLYKYQYNLIK